MQIYLTDNLLFIHEQIIMIALYSCNLFQIERKKELQKNAFIPLFIFT